MARRPRPSPPHAARSLLLVALAAVLSVPMAFLAAPAGAEEPAGAPTLGAVLDGDVAGLTATALSAFAGMDPARPAMEVELTVDNAGDATATVTVPWGTLLATDDEADQTVAVGRPTDDPTLAEVAGSGGVPEIEAAPGTTTVMLTVYCAERDDGAPFEPTPMHFAGMAAEPLPAVLRAIAAQQPADEVAQDAVWWVTDEPTVPVPSTLAPLLADVDAEAFAADPRPVVPDAAYVPAWDRAGVLDEAFDGAAPTPAPGVGGGRGVGPFLWILAATAAATVALVARGRRSRSASPGLVAPTGPGAPGWYPDPWIRGGHRWWDGRTWTSRTLPPT